MNIATGPNSAGLRWIIILLILTLGAIYSATVVLAGDGDFIWVRAAGNNSDDGGIGITVDSSGNVYTTGYFSGTVDFDPGAGTFNLTSVSDTDDIFVSKLDRSGNFVWAVAIGGNAYDYGNGIAVDSSGNVYFTGCFGGTVDFDPGAGAFNRISQGFSDVFISKLDSNGNFVWTRTMGDWAYDCGKDISLDTAGNVYTTGSFKGTVDFDPGAGAYNKSSASDSADIFISKLGTNGDFHWATTFGGSSDDYGDAISVDTSGNVLTTGIFGGLFVVQLKTGAIKVVSNNGGNDIFISRLDSDGDIDWVTSMGGTANDQSESIAIDDTGNVYTSGSFQNTVDFYPGTETFNLTSQGSYDIYISKLSPTGDFVWARAMGGSSYDGGFGISLDSSGNVYTTGYFNGTVDFDPGVGTFNLTGVADTDDIFVNKLDSNGSFIWAKAIGGSSNDVGYSIFTDTSGNVYTTGEFGGTVDFNPGSGEVILTSEGFTDVFVLRLSGNQFPWNMFLPALTNN